MSRAPSEAPPALEPREAAAPPGGIAAAPVRPGRRGSLPAVAAVGAVREWLERLGRELAAAGELRAGAAEEWLLDNAYLLQRVLGRIERDLPPGFQRRLPVIAAGPLAGQPRALALAREALARSELRLDGPALDALVEEWQRAAPLQIGELWALPTLLRLSLLEALAAALREAYPGTPPPNGFGRPTDGADGAALEPVVPSVVRSVRALENLDWRRFFEAHSRVEALLRADPAGEYARADFDTRDRCCKGVEELARDSGRPEAEVAAAALARAGAHPPGAREAHVGYFLIDAGRLELERELGARPALGVRARRALKRHATPAYLGAVALGTALALLPPALWLAVHDATAAQALLGLLLALLPASAVAVAATNWTVTRLLPPQRLPRLDLSEGVPSELRTLVVIPTLLGSEQEIDRLLRQLELHHLGNEDPELAFALLSDLLDADAARLPTDEALVAQARAGVERLNAQHGESGRGPFHLLHRERRWNASEGCWMGWERKRGKLEELARYLDGARDTSYVLHAGDPAGLEGVRFVVTLDSDTRLPRGGAAELIGTLAHPLNRPVVDAKSGRVVAGYDVIQPRAGIAPDSSAASLFAHLFSGDTSVDVYSTAVSDAYQDLFGAGLYVGKGIYDWRAFQRTLRGRVPENALASHDLFEGLHGRVGLASDQVVYEEFPSDPLAHARRLHRWIRGDWQLLPWLARRVPAAGGGRLPNCFTPIGRWNIADNLRRSLVPPALLSLLVAGWTVLPGSPAFWTALALIAPVAHLLGDLAAGLARLLRARELRSRLRGGARRAGLELGRWFFHLAFLPHDARVSCDAIARTLVRLFVTRRHLLEWSTAAHTSGLLASGGRRRRAWLEMLEAPLLAGAIGALVSALRPEALPMALPILLLWTVSPELALLASRPRPERARLARLSPEQTQRLRRLARRTWFFYEVFVGPDDHWLPPDNYQEHPLGELAHRTSPTNIGMLLTSTLSAFDFGYVGPVELAMRLRGVLDTLRRLEHHRGHLLNWYDTRSLDPLLPRYVSSVDSGNLAASLVIVEQGCAEIAAAPVLRRARLEGVLDAVELALEEARALVQRPVGNGEAQACLESVRAVRERVRAALAAPGSWLGAARELLEGPLTACQERLLAHAGDTAAPGLAEVERWIERARFQLQGLHGDVELLLGPVALLEACPDPEVDPAALAELRRVLVPTLALDRIPAACRDARAPLARVLEQRGEAAGGGPDAAALRSWGAELGAALERAEQEAGELHESLLALGAQAGEEMRAMDFRALYDDGRRLLYIGLNLSTNQLDPHHYDLLASEARLTSLVAIAKGDLPFEHWFQLGRAMTRVGRSAVLLSWSATLFEYLMPRLWVRAPDRSLLCESARAAVEHQKRYADARGLPWGISESCYAGFDADQHYQYRAFGVPGLGFKRGLEDDLVVAPYASVMAVDIAPRRLMENLARFRELDAMGTYGLYEALDFTPARVPAGSAAAVVRAYMAHHQGMILMALSNALVDESMRRRFAASALVETSLSLLYEEVPRGVRPERLDAHQVELAAPRPRPSEPPVTWRPETEGQLPEVHLLGNGRLSTLLTDSGGGWLRWKGRSVTRWRPDSTRDDRGLWVYLRDEDTGELFCVGRHPTHEPLEGGEVHFSPHLVRFARHDRGLELSLEVAVAPGEDLEMRRLDVTERGGQRRRLSVFTAAELALGDPREVERHPAFARLFASFVPYADQRAIGFHRRSRAPDEPGIALVHRLVADAPGVALGGWQNDRREFLGRGGRWSAPRAVHSTSQPAGEPLDPLLSLCATVELAPHARARLAFTTAVAERPEEALALSARYASLPALDWLVQDAQRSAERTMAATGVEPALLPRLQRVLSLLVFPHPSLRVPAASLAAPRAGRPALWAHGISGDVPIVLVRQAEAAELELVRQLAAAQLWWRERGARVDLVVLGESASSYEDPIRERLRRALAAARIEVWWGRDGGVHLVPRDQTPAAELRLLEAAAGVVLEAGPGGLERAALEPRERLEAPASFTPARAPEPEPEPTPALEPLVAPDDSNGFGGFAPDGREYVIELPPGTRTPAPWCNVLANERFGCLVSESGLGCTWSENAGENRLTPWSNDPVADEPGEVVYVRDEEDGRVWTVTPLPAGGDGPARIHHGAGVTVYHRACCGLRQRMSVFVPHASAAKVVELELRNLWSRPRRLTLTYYAEWVLGTTRAESAPFLVPSIDEELRALFVHNPWSIDFAERVAFLASSEPLHGFTTDRTEFLGREGELALPAGLRRWGLSGRVEPGGDPCAALQVHLDLSPGETRRVWFVLGQEPDRERAEEAARKARRAAWIDAERRALDERWDELLGALQIETPDAACDHFVNRFGLLQVLSSRVWGRTAFYQSSGAFGFRDQLQDVLCLLHVAPQVARAHLLECARRQFEEGDVLHWWHPPSGRGVRTRCSDDLLWLPYGVAAYVEATGDAGVLEERVPYLGAAPLGPEEPQRYGAFEAARSEGSLLDHCRRALARAWRLGPHGLPLIGAHDWNDAMNRVGSGGRGESVWLAWFAGTCAERFARLCERVGEAGEASEWRERAGALAARVEDSAWDGDWYLRAFFDDGTPLGSRASAECRIDSIAQSWAVLSGLARADRAARATDEAQRLLVTDEPPIARLFDPPFDRAEPHPGYVRGYPPGVRENGGQYTHAAAWLALALVRRGEPDRALRIIRACLGETHAGDRAAAERYRVEPWVVAADVYAGDAHAGRGGWTWYTGSAAWVWRVIVEGFLGLRPVAGALELAPCLPSGWSTVRARVRVGRATYDVAIEDPDGVRRGEVRVELDGRELERPLLPRGAEARRHTVRARLVRG